MKKIKGYYFLALFLVFISYYVLSIIIDNQMIIPRTGLIMQYFKQLTFSEVMNNIGATILRTIISYGVSLIIALILVFVAFFYKLTEFVRPYISILKSFPTVSMILILLIWLGSEKSIYIIPIIVMIPLMYETFLHQLQNIDAKLTDVGKVYQFNGKKQFGYLYFYPLLESLVLSLKQTFGYCFKVIVMAEVIGQSEMGIGARIYFAKVNLDLASMAGVFAWTILLIILVLIIDQLLDYSSKRIIKWK